MTVTFDPAAHPDKLNIGCGWDHREGYVNVDFQDFHEPDLLADARSLDMLPSGHYSEIVAQDVLEHLERAEVDPALAEWARLLKVGGQLIVRVPDLMGVARLIAKQATVEHHHQMLHALFGTQAYTGDYHHAGFTELTLRHSLHAAGLRVDDVQLVDEWLFDAVATKVTDPGPFEPGDLPHVKLSSPTLDATPVVQVEDVEEVDVASTAPPAGRIDSAATALADRLPASVRTRGQSLWRPLRKFVTERRG